MKIRTRLVLEFNVIIIISFLLSGIFIYFIARHNALLQCERTQRETIDDLSNSCYLFERSNHIVNISMPSVTRDNDFMLWAAYQDMNKRVIAHTNRVYDDKIIDDVQSRHAVQLSKSSIHLYKKYGVNILEFVEPITINNVKTGVLRVAFSRDFVKKQMRRDIVNVFKVFLGISFFVLVCSTSVAYFHGSKLLHQISGLIKGASALTRGMAGYTVPKLSSDEIGILTERFNTMSNTLKEMDQLKDSFITHVSHELQSPLAVIQGFFEKLQEDNIDAQTKKEYIGHIQQGVNRLGHLISQTLNLTRLKAGKTDYSFEPIQVKELIEEHAEFFRVKAEEQSLSIRTDVSELCGSILADREAMADVFSNLISNAIKFTPTPLQKATAVKPQMNAGILPAKRETDKAAPVKVSGFTRSGEIIIWAKPSAKHIEMGVKDTGIGIPQEFHGRIFDRFERVKEHMPKDKNIPGTGLGLSIVKEIIKLHGGTISVESQPHKGSNFIITLPHT